MRRLLALAACLLLAGCGSSGEEQGTASLWITRDRGATVLYEGEVEAGQTVMQALRSAADTDTRYGGRFVQAIDGLAGSLVQGRDWFYFVNGVAADRGAAEYRLRGGDIAWWDYRRWAGRAEISIVVGSFPEPLLHGYDGKVRPTAVRYERAEQRVAAEAIGRLVDAESVEPERVAIPRGANTVRLDFGKFRLQAATESPTGPYTFVIGGRPEQIQNLAAHPERVRFRFQVAAP